MSLSTLAYVFNYCLYIGIFSDLKLWVAVTLRNFKWIKDDISLVVDLAVNIVSNSETFIFNLLCHVNLQFYGGNYNTTHTIN